MSHLESGPEADVDHAVKHMQRYRGFEHYEPRGDRYTGDYNTVLFVDDGSGPFVLKVPHNPDIGMHRLENEALILAVLDEKEPASPFDLPTPVNFNSSPVYLMLAFTEGHALGVRDINSLTEDEHRALGRDMAQFVWWLGRAMDLSEYNELIPPVRDMPYIRRLGYLGAEHIARFSPRFSNYGEFKYIVADLVALARDYKLREQAPTIIGHGDLRPDNLLLKKTAGTWCLSGVIDFDEIGPSLPEYELRHLALMSPVALAAGIHEYERLSHKRLCHELITLWAGIQIVSNTMWVVRKKELTYEHFIRLQQIWPDDWPDLLSLFPDKAD